MSLKNFISENVFLPLGDLVTGQFVHSKLMFLMKSQYWSRDQIDNYQNEKLRLLIQHSYKNVPFYRELFNDLRLKPEDIQNKTDLKKLPIITKEDLKKASGKNIAQNIDKNHLLYRSSSGSTGEPFQFYTTKEAESFLRAAAIRGWYWMGYRLGDKYAKISMNPRASLLKRIQDKLNSSLYLSSTQLTKPIFKTIIESIKKFDPEVIRGYPVPLLFLANQIKSGEKAYKGMSLKAINTTGSTLSDDTRKIIEDVFSVKIYDSYSCEGGTIFFQCSTSGCYHPAEEYGISEFIADGFTFSNENKPMRHIATDLINYASPFIRYDTQDYVTLGSDKQCSCSRSFLNIKQIMGRDSDIIRTPSGKYLIVENFVAYFEWIQEVDQIQIVQEELDVIIIKMIVNSSFNDSIYKKIFDYWSDYIGADVRLKIEIVDEIKLTPTGKRRTVIRNQKISIDA